MKMRHRRAPRRAPWVPYDNLADLKASRQWSDYLDAIRPGNFFRRVEVSLEDLERLYPLVDPTGAIDGAPQDAAETGQGAYVIMVEPDYGADMLAALKGDGTDKLEPGVKIIKGEIGRLLT